MSIVHMEKNYYGKQILFGRKKWLANGIYEYEQNKQLLFYTNLRQENIM